MAALIIFFCSFLGFIIATVLFSLIKGRTGRIISIIILLIILMGSMTFLLFKVSGQQKFINTFDGITNPNNNAQNDVVTTINNFLNAWHKQDIDELSSIVTDKFRAALK